VSKLTLLMPVVAVNGTICRDDLFFEIEGGTIREASAWRPLYRCLRPPG